MNVCLNKDVTSSFKQSSQRKIISKVANNIDNKISECNNSLFPIISKEKLNEDNLKVIDNSDYYQSSESIYYKFKH